MGFDSTMRDRQLSPQKKVREKSWECHNHKPQPFPDTKKKTKKKQTKPNKRKSNKRTKSTKISSLFPKRGNRNAKKTEKHKNKITQGFVCVEVLRPSQPNGVMSSAVSLPNHTFTGQA